MAESKKIYTLIILTIVFLIALYLALFAGYKDSGIHLLFKSFDVSNDADSIILTVLRYPRVLKGFIAGSCLALAGLFMQAVSKNPLAEPYLTGVSSGAGLGIVISVIYFNSMNYSLFGFAGALISSAAVILFAGISRFSAAKMILTGLSVNLFASSLISLFILMHADKSHLIMFILSGGFNSGGLVPDKTLFAVFSAALAASCFVIPKLNFLRLDEFIRELAISETELDAWYNNRLERRKELIPTLLPLVYQTGNELTAANGLILNRSKDLWGIQLLPRLVLPAVRKDCLKSSWHERPDFDLMPALTSVLHIHALNKNNDRCFSLDYDRRPSILHRTTRNRNPTNDPVKSSCDQSAFVSAVQSAAYRTVLNQHF